MDRIIKPIDFVKEAFPETYLKYYPWAEVNQSEVYWAASEGKPHYLQALLNRGIDPNFLDKKINNSPLLAATQNDHISTIKVLLANKAQVQYQGNKVLHEAFDKQKLYIAGLLLAQKPDLMKSYESEGISLLGYIEEHFDDGNEKNFLLNHILQCNNLDEIILSSFNKSEFPEQLRRIMLAHKPTAQKVFFKAFASNDQITLQKFLGNKKYIDQLAGIGSQLTTSERITMSKQLSEISFGVFDIPDDLEFLKIYNKECLEKKFRSLKREYDKIYEKYLKLKEHFDNDFEHFHKQDKILCWNDDLKRKKKEQRYFWGEEFNSKSSPEELYNLIGSMKKEVEEVKLLIRKHTVFKQRGANCPVCLESYKAKGIVVICENAHCLCEDCFLEINDNCPICREKCL